MVDQRIIPTDRLPNAQNTDRNQIPWIAICLYGIGAIDMVSGLYFFVTGSIYIFHMFRMPISRIPHAIDAINVLIATFIGLLSVISGIVFVAFGKAISLLSEIKNRLPTNP